MLARLRAVPGRLGRQVGRRGVVLLFFAIVDLAYGYGFAYPTASSLDSPVFRFFGDIFTPLLSQRAGLLIWGCLWGGVGLACLVYAFRRWDKPAYIAALLLTCFWVAAITGACIFVGLERGYLSVAIWGFFFVMAAAHLNWRENDDRGAA